MGFALYSASGTITADPTIQPGTLAAYLWAEAGNGGTALHGTSSGGGGGGGAFGADTAYPGVTPGFTSLTMQIGTGGQGLDSQLSGGTYMMVAAHGQNASGFTKGLGGAAGTTPIAFKGGDGVNGQNGSSISGTGGGGSAGSTGAGGNATGVTGGPAGTGGTTFGQSLAGQAGASGTGTTTNGANGAFPGAGASGGGSGTGANKTGGTGGGGQILLTWTDQTWSLAIWSAMPMIMQTAKHAVSQFAAYMSLTMGPRQISVVNQWSATFAQPAVFGNMPPAMQSVNVPLTPATAGPGGSGSATPGNWLFCLVTVNEPSATAGYTVGVADATHGWWRTGDETTSTWASSTAAGLTRTMARFIPNTARQVSTVYVAPNGPCDAISVLVIEVSGLSQWDVVTGISTNYAGAATSLALALGVPAAQAFVIVAAGGDSTAAGQALTPSGWTPLETVTATNGTDHTCDAVLSVACLTTSSAISVSATASTATDLSGVAIGVMVAAPSPVPSGQNPNWPYLRLEAAFGSGYQTPADERTWTSLNDWVISHAPRRFWSFTDNSGVAYAQGQLQSATGGFQLDNFDGALSIWNSLSPYFGLLDTGVPIRIRASIGTIKGAQLNRTYVIERNALKWPEKRSRTLRNYVPLTTTDVWSVMADSCPSPYRGEVHQDQPGWWWTMDDQPLAAGVLPTFLRNSADGTTIPLNILHDPAGGQPQPVYTIAGGVTPTGNAPLPTIATYQVGQSSGWMYGDPPSSLQTAQSGNPTTSQPGSAAWQQAGAAGNTGGFGWFLSVNDPTFPALSAGGASLEVWFQFPFFGSATGVSTGGSTAPATQDPYCPLTILNVTSGTAAAAQLQLDLSGHLQLLTYNGGSSTSHAIYTGSDLRSASWHHAVVELTTTGWRVLLDGGLNADVSGSATGMPDFTWLTANGDMGSAAASVTADIQHGGNIQISHLAVYPGLLPAWRARAHYNAAITGFGALPAPQQIQVQMSVTGYAPDGSVTAGPNPGTHGGYGGPIGTAGQVNITGVVAATAGAYTSAPAAYSVATNYGADMFAWVGWTGLAPSFQVFTSAALGAEAQAAVVNGAGDAFVSGYGAGASGVGFCQTAAGSGAAPPTSGSALGDQVWQRIERVLGYGRIRVPNRAIDAGADELVAAGNDVGGQQTGANLQNLVDSDNGLMSVDLLNSLCYRSRPQLAADPVVWNIGMNPITTGRIPFDRDITWSGDPQRVWDSITVSPYSPDGSTLPVITPTNATAVNAAITQRGPRPKAVTSYLQDQSKMQAQADWLFANFSTLQRRAEVVTIDAAKHPLGWEMFFSANVGDIASIFDVPVGGMPPSTGSYRISNMSRSLSNNANGTPVEGKMTLVLDPLPASYWS